MSGDICLFCDDPKPCECDDIEIDVCLGCGRTIDGSGEGEQLCKKCRPPERGA